MYEKLDGIDVPHFGQLLLIPETAVDGSETVSSFLDKLNDILLGRIYGPQASGPSQPLDQ